MTVTDTGAATGPMTTETSTGGSAPSAVRAPADVGTDARSALLAAIADIERGPAVANFLVRGADLVGGSPRSIDFEADVAAEVIADVLQFARNLSERELIPYDPSYQPSPGQALVDDLSEAPEFAEVHRQVMTGMPPLDDGRGDPVAALAHRVDGPSGLALSVYRVKGPGIATKRASGIRILVPRSGVYTRIEDELVYYQPRFDVLVVGSAVIVTAPSTLQRALGSDTRARSLATATFARATRHIDVEGMRDLAEAVRSDPAMIAKMAQLSRTFEADPEYERLLTTRRLLEFLDDNPQVPIRVEGEGQARHLVFEPSPQKRYLIPKALADDFLRSELTNRHYEVGSKQRIDGGS
jgi:hypothetical protein